MLNLVIDPAQIPDAKSIVHYSTKSPLQNCGIYFLINGGEIVYVGQSIDCEIRVRKHVLDKKKEFSRYYVFRCSAELLNIYEAFCLWKFQPKYNKHLPIQPFITVFGAYIKSKGISLATKRNRMIAAECKGKRYWSINELNNIFESQNS